MKKISLIKDLEYKRIYNNVTTINGETYIDGNNYKFWTTSLIKNIYKADELVTVDSKYSTIVENVVNRYIELFTERGLEATPQQIDFARETSKILLGKLINKKIIPVIPAPCGFGKSTVTQVFLEEVCKAIKEGIIEDGIIIITDKLEQLYELHNNINNAIGNYKVEVVNNKTYETPFTYVLEGWREDSYERGVCKNKDIKKYEYGMCSPKNCPYFGECKISKQKTSQKFSPILLITNARLETFGESLDMYCKYVDLNKESQSRNIRINDEKPSMRDNLRINIKVLNNIKNEIYSINNIEDRRILIDKFNKIISIIEDKFKDYEIYNRIIISNINNSPILLNDKEFVELWNTYMGTKFKNELKHIQTVLSKGGLYCNTAGEGIFIYTLGMKNIVNEKLKTVIFDGTALIDQDYSNEDIIRFVDIENPRTFENVTFNFYMKNKLTKTEFNNKKYLVKACAKFIDTINKEKTYIVTYNERAKTMLTEIKKNNSSLKYGFGKINIATLDEDTLFYFGNTKGSNKAKDCTQMVQFGWNNLPDYEYLTRYISTNLSEERLNKIFEIFTDLEKGKRLMDLLGNDSSEIKLYKNYSMLTDFVQEVYRIKLRQYDCNDNIIIHCFKCDRLLIKMISQLFPGCTINTPDENLKCFQESKADNRENKGESYTKFKEWLDSQIKGREVKSKILYEESGLDTKSLNKLKSKNKYVKLWFNNHTKCKGNYVI